MVTTAHLLGRYVEALTARRCSPTTIRSVRSVLTGLSRHTGKRLDEITHDDLLTWQATRAEEIGGRTLRTQVGYITVFYTWAHDFGHVHDNPARRIRAPHARLSLPRPIPEGRLARAMDAADPPMAAILGLAAFAGLRAKEIAGLEWADCYLDDDEPYLRIVSGKGDRERLVDCSLELRDLLIAVPGTRRGPVFKRLDGQPGHITANNLSKMGNRHLHDCDVTDTLHSLRHRFITEIARRGGIHRAREAAGHASISTTSVYTQVLSREVRPLVEQVGHLLTAG